MRPPTSAAQQNHHRFGYLMVAYIAFMASAFVVIHLLHPSPVLRYIRKVTGNKMLNTSLLLPPASSTTMDDGGNDESSTSRNSGKSPFSEIKQQQQQEGGGSLSPPPRMDRSLLGGGGGGAGANKKNSLALVVVSPNPIPKDRYPHIVKYFSNRLPAKVRMMNPWMLVMDYPVSYFLTNIVQMKHVPYVDANLISFIHPFCGFLCVYFLFTSVKEVPRSTPLNNSNNGDEDDEMNMGAVVVDDSNNKNNNSMVVENSASITISGGSGRELPGAGGVSSSTTPPSAGGGGGGGGGGGASTLRPVSPAAAASPPPSFPQKHIRHHSRGASLGGSVGGLDTITGGGKSSGDLSASAGAIELKNIIASGTDTSGLSKRKQVSSNDAAVMGSPLTVVASGGGGTSAVGGGGGGGAASSPVGTSMPSRSFSMEVDGGGSAGVTMGSAVGSGGESGCGAGGGSGGENNSAVNVNGGGGDVSGAATTAGDTAKESHSLLYTDDGTRFTQDAWRLRLAGVCLFFRNFLDTFDGVMARSQIEAGIPKRGVLKDADGHVIDATMDTIGSTVVFITIFVVLYRRRVLLSPLVTRFLAMCGFSFHKQRPLLAGRIVGFVGCLGLLYIAPLWETFVMRYTHLFDPNVLKYAADLVPLEQKINVRFSLFLWSTVCGDSVLFLAFLCMFYDVLWEMVQYLFFAYIPCVTAIWVYAIIVWNESVLDNPVAKQLWKNYEALQG